MAPHLVNVVVPRESSWSLGGPLSPPCPRSGAHRAFTRKRVFLV